MIDDLHKLFQIRMNCECEITLGFPSDLRNFRRILAVSCEVFVCISDCIPLLPLCELRLQFRTLAFLTICILGEMCEEIALLLLCFLVGEGLDEVALEDLCCHSQKMFILVPPSCPYIHSSTILASPAIDHSMPESFRVHLDTPRTTIGTKLSQLQSIFNY